MGMNILDMIKPYALSFIMFARDQLPFSAEAVD